MTWVNIVSAAIVSVGIFASANGNPSRNQTLLAGGLSAIAAGSAALLKQVGWGESAQKHRQSAVEFEVAANELKWWLDKYPDSGNAASDNELRHIIKVVEKADQESLGLSDGCRKKAKEVHESGKDGMLPPVRR